MPDGPAGRWAVLVAAVVIPPAVLFALIGEPAVWLTAVLQLAMELGVAALVVASAGGLGWLTMRRLMPTDAPAGLRVVTAIGGGLWLLSTLVLAAGTLLGAAGLSAMLWWPVVLAGAAAAAVLMWRRLRGVNIQWRPGWTTVALAVLLALAAGLWLAGATRAPGYWQGLTDEYDVLLVDVYSGEVVDVIHDFFW